MEPIEPKEAKRLYLESRKGEVSRGTLQGYHYRLKQFVRWCDDVEDIDNLNTLTGRDLQRFKTWRREDGDLKPVSLQGQLDTLKLFLRWCESMNGVEKGLHKDLEALIPQLTKSDQQSNSILESDEAESVLQYIRKFEYASRTHLIMEILWHTGIRLGALYSLDVKDYDGDQERLEVHHRPRTETPLKNGDEGERMVAMNAKACRVIEDWIEHHRHDVEDDHGRNPLLTTENGRMPKSSIRDAVYKVTRPCYYSGECPEGKEPDDCDATTYPHYSKCPVNVSPHDIRRGSITHFLTEDIPEKVVSDRMNLSQDVLDKHYDKRKEEVKVEQRRVYLENV